MKLLTHDEELGEWRYIQVSFWSLFKFYFWLEIARTGLLVLILVVLAVIISVLGV